MNGPADKILAELGYGAGVCKWCNGPELEIHGNTEQGIYRIDCSDCGARFTRMDGPEAIAWAGRQVTAAAELKDCQLAHESIVALWNLMLVVAWPPAKTKTWLQTRAGNMPEDDDACPF